MTNTNKAVMGVAVLFIFAVLFIAYQALVVAPQARLEAAAEATRVAEQQRQADYAQCEADAFTEYSRAWDDKCAIEGLQPDCKMEMYKAEPIKEAYEANKDRCVALFN